MAKTESNPAISESRLFVLALGLLVGFVIAFVLLLSRLPVDGIVSQQSDDGNRDAEMAEIDFDYYSVLQQQEAARKPEIQRQSVAVEPPVVFTEPPAQILPQREASPAPLVVERPLVQSQPVEPVEPVATQAAEIPAGAPASQPVPVREIPASRAGQDSYYIEAGNYPDNDGALRAQTVLQSLGLDAFIVVRQNNSGDFGHRVRIGPIVEQSRLDATRSTLRNNGMQPKIIRVRG